MKGLDKTIAIFTGNRAEYTLYYLLIQSKIIKLNYKLTFLDTFREKFYKIAIKLKKMVLK